LTFPLIMAHVDEMVTVSEAAIVAAVRFLLLRLKLLVEPSGALGVAALMSGAILPRGRVGVILSGGNIDPPTLMRVIDEG
jgi:threonine dehydratase